MNCIIDGKYTGYSCFGCKVKVEDCEIRDRVYRRRWIPVSEGLPEEHRCLDEDDCYRMSENVLCSAYNEDINEYETWIDYTIDGEWQAHEYYEGEKLAWQPLPEPWKGE